MKHAKDKQTVERRKRVIIRLEEQLKAGTKTSKGSRNTQELLTDSDVTRINKQLLVLKERV